MPSTNQPTKPTAQVARPLPVGDVQPIVRSSLRRRSPRQTHVGTESAAKTCRDLAGRRHRAFQPDLAQRFCSHARNPCKVRPAKSALLFGLFSLSLRELAAFRDSSCEVCCLCKTNFTHQRLNHVRCHVHLI